MCVNKCVLSVYKCMRIFSSSWSLLALWSVNVPQTLCFKEEQTQTPLPFFSGAQVLDLIRHLCYLILEPLKVKGEEKENSEVSDERSQTQTEQSIRDWLSHNFNLQGMLERHHSAATMTNIIQTFHHMGTSLAQAWNMKRVWSRLGGKTKDGKEKRGAWERMLEWERQSWVIPSCLMSSWWEE